MGLQGFNRVTMFVVMHVVAFMLLVEFSNGGVIEVRPVVACFNGQPCPMSKCPQGQILGRNCLLAECP